MRDNRIDQEVAERVLHALRDKKQTEFSSHDFLKVYCAQNEGNYIDWLIQYIESDEIFKTAHSQIAYFLAKNAGNFCLYIMKLGIEKARMCMERMIIRCDSHGSNSE